MEICSYTAQGANQHQEIYDKDVLENMKSPKIVSWCDNYTLSSSSSLSVSSSTTDLSSNRSTISSAESSSSCKSSFNKPSWLCSTVADLDEKMKIVANSKEVDCNKSENDSFAQRAEAYYQTRPQLLALLNDLYHDYVALADRYAQTIAKHKRSPISEIHFDGKHNDYGHDVQAEEEVFIDSEHVAESEDESSVSFQGPTRLNEPVNAELVVAELIIKMVDFELVANELGMAERRGNESSRKIELQRSLLEVLESERVILLNENSRLGYKVAMFADENKELMGENMFMKRKAEELARCMLKVREDHRVCMLIRKIEDLQGQIYSLEKRNKVYYQQIIKRDAMWMQLQNHQAKKNGKNGNGVPTLGDRFWAEEEAEEEKVVSKTGEKVSSRDTDSNSTKSGRTLSKLWDRVKNLDLLQCGPHFKN